MEEPDNSVGLVRSNFIGIRQCFLFHFGDGAPLVPGLFFDRGANGCTAHHRLNQGSTMRNVWAQDRLLLLIKADSQQPQQLPFMLFISSRICRQLTEINRLTELDQDMF